MSYAFTPTGYYATFDSKRSPGGIVQCPIEAWSADGDALVVDNDAGRLVPVRSLAGFKQLRACRQSRGVLPAAAGWSVRYTSEGEESFSLPVVGWLVDGDGDGLPLVASREGVGLVDELDRPNQCVLVAPDETSAPQP